MSCILCDRIKSLKVLDYPLVIHEFKNSYLMLGEHQYYKGYCVLVLKDHHREMTDIPSPEREEFFQEMMMASSVIEKVFKPKKMNMCSLGNVVDHVHWHFFPRYVDDPHFTNPPWLQMHHFNSATITQDMSAQIITRLKAAF